MKYSKRQAVTYLTASQCSGGRFYSRVLYFFVGCIEPKRRTRIVDRAARTAAQRERSRNMYVRRWDGIMGGRGKKGGGGGGCSTLNVVPDFRIPPHNILYTYIYTYTHTVTHTPTSKISVSPSEIERHAAPSRSLSLSLIPSLAYEGLALPHITQLR